MKTITTPATAPFPEIRLTHPQEQCLFFDIETTGLSPRASSLYLIGVMAYHPAEKAWTITQWFADKYREEEAMIHLFLDTLEQYKVLYHFNGKTFDIPYLLHKAEKYHIELSEHACRILQDTTGSLSIDLLAQIRPLKKTLGIAKASQTDLERWMGITRKDTFTGGELISVYSQYMQDRLLHPDQAEKLEHFLLLHNHDDMEGMLAVSRMLHYRNLFDVIPVFKDHLQITNIALTPTSGNSESRLILTFRHDASLPQSVSLTHSYPESKDLTSKHLPENCILDLDADMGTLHIPVITGELKYFLPDPKEYFYLPSEDQAIHRSVAEFVEPSHRKKATAATCYQRKQGRFLPALAQYRANRFASPQDTPVFLKTYRDKLCFYELPDALEPEYPFWKEYLIQTLQAW